MNNDKYCSSKQTRVSWLVPAVRVSAVILFYALRLYFDISVGKTHYYSYTVHTIELKCTAESLSEWIQKLYKIILGISIPFPYSYKAAYYHDISV